MPGPPCPPSNGRRKSFSQDIAIIGGCGRVGLPLGIAFADSGLRVSLYDLNADAVSRVNSGLLPFTEPDAEGPFHTALADRRLSATTDAGAISEAETIIVVIGTPVDRHLNPDPQGVPDAIAAFSDRLRPGQLLVLRSTLYPGVTALVERLIAKLCPGVDVAFCPERIAEGKAMDELRSLPQIVSARTKRVVARASHIFERLTPKIIVLEPEEAELAKLFTNVWRYVKFAIANQLYMIANDFDLDFERIRTAIATEYPRAADMPGAGFTAGPCLFKDTMQLAAFNNNQFTLGHASMMINEGLPLYIVARLERQFDLSSMTVGILGMSFKADSDDIRSSLSYKVKRIMKFKARRVLCTDPYVSCDPDLQPLETVVEESDLLLIGTPHPVYAQLRPTAPVVDVYNLLGRGVRV
jgi:UDP-N-acetyl-D-mannosaminuronic acid dehydrogenase